MKPIAIIKKSIEQAAADGIRIKPGATFDWVHGSFPNQRVDGRPRAVNWMGAVLWVYRRVDEPDFSFRRLKALIGCDFSWAYRFGYGFNQGRALSVLDPETMREVRKEEVSLAGSLMAKEFRS